MNIRLEASLLLASCLAPMYASAQAPPRPDQLVAPVAIVSNEYSPSDMAVDDGSIYWISDAGSKIKKANKDGSNPTIVITGQHVIQKIFVDENYIFFVVLGEIRRAGKNGGTVSTIVYSPLLGYGNAPFAMDQTSIYFLEDVNDYTSRLVKVRKNNGVRETLAPRIELPVGLATDGSNVFWTNLAGNRIKRISVNGGPIKMLGRCGGTLQVADGEGIYCAREGKIWSFPKIGGKPVAIVVLRTDYGDNRIVFDEENFYTRASVKGVFGIYKINKDGGQHRLIASVDLFTTKNFVIDASSIYWTDSRQGAVMRLHK
jgi:hypothetical protein